MRSLKRTLALWVSVSSIVLSVAAGVLLYLMIRSYLTTQFDTSLIRKARLLASTIEVEIDALELGFEDLDMSEFESPQSGGYLQVYHLSESLYRSPSLGENDLPIDVTDQTITRVITLDLPGGRIGRGVVCRVEPVQDLADLDEFRGHDDDGSGRSVLMVDEDQDVTVTLCLARDTREIDEPLHALRLAMLGVGLLLAAGLSLLTYLAVGRGMRPVDDLARAVGELDEKSLDRRLQLQNLPDELTPIVQQFNALMPRLHLAFERERGFSADLAHELRTPLAGLRTTIDVARSRPRDEHEYQRCLDQLLVMTDQMQSLVEGLLQLAKLERGLLKLARQDVNPDDLVRAVWQPISENTKRPDGFTATLSLESNRTIQTDPALLTIVLRNVLENAAHYVNGGGDINITTLADGQGVTIRVTNTGSRVSQTDAAKVFDRFWRADDARSDTGSRFGLGLALARQAIEALAGTIEVHTQAGGDFVVRITLPG